MKKDALLVMLFYGAIALGLFGNVYNSNLCPASAFEITTQMKSRSTIRAPLKICMSAKGFGVMKPKFKYTGRLQPGKVSPAPTVPEYIPKPDYAVDGIPKSGKVGLKQWKINPQTPEDIQRMRVSGRIAREVLDSAVRFVKPGITTEMIDNLVHDEIIQRGAYPSPLNYHGFPRSCCTSINEVICHGIPDSTVLQVRYACLPQSTYLIVSASKKFTLDITGYLTSFILI